jgi:hypothetical protein
MFCEREIKREYHCLIKELMLVDHELFFKMFRMMPNQFEELLTLVAPKITKAKTRPGVISPAERRCFTLRYLASGYGYSSIAASYRIGRTTVSRIVHETAQIIWNSLSEDGHLRVTQHAGDWRKIADVFENKWNFPNCLGAMDGKHVTIHAPPSSGSLFFNYKKYSVTIVLPMWTLVKLVDKVIVGFLEIATLAIVLIMTSFHYQIPDLLMDQDLFFPMFFCCR